MAKFTMNIDPQLKADAAELFDKMGLNMTTAVTMFLKQSVRNGQLPFQPSSYPSQYHSPRPRPGIDYDPEQDIAEARRAVASVRLPSHIGQLSPEDVKEELANRVR